MVMELDDLKEWENWMSANLRWTKINCGPHHKSHPVSFWHVPSLPDQCFFLKRTLKMLLDVYFISRPFPKTFHSCFVFLYCKVHWLPASFVYLKTSNKNATAQYRRHKNKQNGYHMTTWLLLAPILPQENSPLKVVWERSLAKWPFMYKSHINIFLTGHDMTTRQSPKPSCYLGIAMMEICCGGETWTWI